MEKQHVGEEKFTGSAVATGSAVGTGSALGNTSMVCPGAGKGKGASHQDVAWYRRNAPCFDESGSMNDMMVDDSEWDRGSAISREGSLDSAVWPGDICRDCDEDGTPYVIPDPNLHCKVCQVKISAVCDVKEWRDLNHHAWGWYTPVTPKDGTPPYKVPNGATCKVCRYAWEALGWKYENLGTIQVYQKNLANPNSDARKHQSAFLQSRADYVKDKNNTEARHEDSGKGSKKRRLTQSEKNEIQETAKATLEIVEREGYVDKAPTDEFVLEDYWDERPPSLGGRGPKPSVPADWDFVAGQRVKGWWIKGTPGSFTRQYKVEHVGEKRERFEDDKGVGGQKRLEKAQNMVHAEITKTLKANHESAVMAPQTPEMLLLAGLATLGHVLPTAADPSASDGAVPNTGSAAVEEEDDEEGEKEDDEDPEMQLRSFLQTKLLENSKVIKLQLRQLVHN